MIRSGEAISGALTPSITPSSYQEPNPLLNLISAALSDKSLDHPSRRPPSLALTVAMATGPP